MSSTIQVGVAGVGALGEHHARLYAEMESAELVGVFDTDPARADAIASAYGTRTFDSLAEMGNAVSAASVAVPTDAHLDVASELMQHDVHLLVEKPIASTTAEAETLVDLARDKDLVLQAGHVERFNPVMRFLEDNLSAPQFIEAIRLAPFPPPRPDAPPRGTEVSVVLDLMIHDLDIILHLVGSPVTDIRAVGVPVLSEGEDIANARLGFENGCVANVTASRISLERMRKIRVFQKDTYVSLDYMGQAGRLHRKEGNAITTTEIPIEKGEPLAEELASFVDCVRTRRDPVVTGEHASEALGLAVAILRCLRDTPS